MIESLSFCVIDPGCPEEVFGRCVGSIERQGAPDYEIIVLGHGRGRGGVRFIGGGMTGAGICKARNHICSQASKEFICLIEPDIELAPEWYKNIRFADCLDIIGSRINNEDGRRCVDWAFPVELGAEVFPYPLDYDEWSARAYIRGNLVVIRKRAWERTRFDEGLNADTGEDADFCLRAASEGFRTGIFPGAPAILHNSPSLIRRRHITSDEPYRIVKGFRAAFYAGKEAYGRKEFGEAVKYFKEASSIVPKDPDAWAYKGWSLYSLGRYDEAIEDFSEAIRLNPELHFAGRGLGWAYLQKGLYLEAVRELSEALNLIKPVEKEAWAGAARGLGWAHYHSRRFKEAIGCFKKIIEETSPDESHILSDALMALGWSLYQSSDFEGAIDAFSKAHDSSGPESYIAAEALKAIKLAGKGKEGPQVFPGPVNGRWPAQSKIHTFVSSVKKRVKRGLKQALSG
ncbi:MAG: tetratricopeptide repeat protein [Deltaproteobacteria bacterium]|nr:tetratricopeptide repeat protein [Deltaproteobacteria bacterium]